MYGGNEGDEALTVEDSGVKEGLKKVHNDRRQNSGRGGAEWWER
jgi:hypothetical protein